MEIADGHVGKPDVFADDFDDAFDQLIVLDDLHAGQPQAFLKDRGRIGREAPGNRAADVEPMRDIDGKGDKPAFGKDRAHDRDITRMGAAAKRVVRYNHVTGKNRRAEPVDDASDLRAEGSGKKRNSIGLGDELALCIADAACEIQNLVDEPGSCWSWSSRSPFRRRRRGACPG